LFLPDRVISKTSRDFDYFCLIYMNQICNSMLEETTK